MFIHFFSLEYYNLIILGPFEIFCPYNCIKFSILCFILSCILFRIFRFIWWQFYYEWWLSHVQKNWYEFDNFKEDEGHSN